MSIASNIGTQSDDNQSSSQGSIEDIEEPQFDESIFDSQESIHLAPTLSTKTTKTDNQSMREEITDREETTQAVQETNCNVRTNPKLSETTYTKLNQPTHINVYMWAKMLLGKIWKWIPSFCMPMTQYLQGQLDIKQTHNLGSPKWDVIRKTERNLY
ncbi:hypothetical protein BC835DRAFT_1305450 [Cytidiella melzeri]|nr:hypothetical protein BC835DRAFT_1305450 [Cytidiella melzeri]